MKQEKGIRRVSIDVELRKDMETHMHVDTDIKHFLKVFNIQEEDLSMTDIRMEVKIDLVFKTHPSEDFFS